MQKGPRDPACCLLTSPCGQEELACCLYTFPSLNMSSPLPCCVATMPQVDTAGDRCALAGFGIGVAE